MQNINFIYSQTRVAAAKNLSKIIGISTHERRHKFVDTIITNKNLNNSARMQTEQIKGILTEFY